MSARDRFRFNLLSLRPVRLALRRPELPLALQGGALAGLLFLAVTGWNIGQDLPAKELLVLRKTNLTTLVVWGLWWPGMIVAALLLGRAWCTACPLELVNRVGDAIGRRLGVPRVRVTRWMRAGWLVIAGYLTLQLLVAGASIHRVPHYTAVLLLALLGTALLAGVTFNESRSFCKVFCPASALLSVYGRKAPVQLDVVDTDTCSRCTTRDCISVANRYKLDARSCPSNIRPFARASSDGCVLCLQCAKVCPEQNIAFGPLSSTVAASRGSTLLRPFEAAFVIIATGFVTHEVVGEVKWLEEAFHVVPKWLGSVAPSLAFGWVEAIWFLVLMPAMLWSCVVAISYALGHRSSVRELLLIATTAAAPVIAVAHLAKALAKITSWGSFLPGALHSPAGRDVATRILAGEASPAKLVSLAVVGWIVLGVIAFAALRAIHWTQATPSRLPAARTAVLVTASMFSAVLVVWIRG